MKKTLSIMLLGGILLLPVGLVVGLTYAGVSHPLEGKIVQGPSILDGSSFKVEILFFGYVGCAEVCPTSLSKISKVLDTLKSHNKGTEVGALFVDINNGHHSYSADKYAGQFSDAIRGIKAGERELKQLSDTFQLRYTHRSGTQGELFHTDHFFILKRGSEGWEIARVMANQSSVSELSEAVTQQLIH